MAVRMTGSGVTRWCFLLVAIFTSTNRSMDRLRATSTRCFSHSRPQHVPKSKRKRMLYRPKNTFKRHMGISERKRKLYFASWPLDSSSSQVREGTQSQVQQLAQKTERVANTREVAKRVGHCSAIRRDKLLRVHDAQEQCDIEPDGIQSRMFMSCLKDGTLSKAVLARRKKLGLQLGQSVWCAMPPPTSEFDFSPALGSAWNLCTAIAVKFRTLSPHEILLGNLINEAGMLHNFCRADHLWTLLVRKLAVKPNCICYVSYARAHLLSGRPATAVQILDSMADASLGKGNGQASIIYLQALLLMCHSKPSKSRLSGLNTFLTSSAALNLTGNGKRMQQEWGELRRAAQKLLSKPTSVRFREVLLTDNARRKSVMRTWPNLQADSGYLADET